MEKHGKSTYQKSKSGVETHRRGRGSFLRERTGGLNTKF